ncbi:MAG: DNA repair protein RecO [Lachnospiraceae bacterium]|nr:DNA repair protein RecO [Lachnospiraceae bacterium]
MEGLIKVRGIVLSERAVGEYDRLVVILTVERGKIRAFARGAKRPRNHLSAALQPFHYGTFSLYAGRDSYNVQDAEISNYFEGVRRDLDNSMTGMFFLELADYYGRENDDNSALTALLYQSLRALENGKPDRRLVRAVYEIRTLVIDGQYPGIPDGSWQASTVYAMDMIANSTIEKLYTFEVSEEVLNELLRIAKMYRKQFIDRELKSLKYCE